MVYFLFNIKFNTVIDDGVDFWTKIFNLYRLSAYYIGGKAKPRPLRKLGIWGPMNDSRGRAMQSFVDPIAYSDGDASRVLNYKARTTPTN